MVEERPFTDASFRQFLNEEKIMGSRCKKCCALYAPPRPICPKCHGNQMEWVPVKGTGKLAAFTCISIGTAAMMAEGYDRKRPYISCVVRLDEGVKLDARLEGVDGTKPDSIKVGMPVAARFLHRGEGENLKTFLAFGPV